MDIIQHFNGRTTQGVYFKLNLYAREKDSTMDMQWQRLL